MKPKRYPYSGKRRILDRLTLRSVDIKTSIMESNNSSITFGGDNIILNGQSILGRIQIGGERMQILLYKLRKEHGLSQREMAKLINKSEVSYRNKELGKTDFTQSEMFIIAQHFNKELGDIFTP